MMKVVAFNCSPKTNKGNTALILDPFLEGMKGAGADVELFYTKKLNIKPCQGEFNCWFKSPGKCFQDDDMERLHPKLSEAEVWIFATPVYVDGVSGPMKNLLDRMIPHALPFVELRDGHCRHPLREGERVKKIVLVSNCGFWELDNFDPLLVHMEAACRNLSAEFAGALLRPHGPVLGQMLEMGAPVNDVLEAAGEAGRQLVEDGRMREETLKIVGRELLPLEQYLEQLNLLFRQNLEAAGAE
jgi:multimeric flavodoxin WrbA